MDLAHKKARNLTKNLAILVFLFAKLKINELDLDTQIGDKRCNSISHMLNLTLSRVMICKPFFFLNPLFFAFSDFSACHHLTP